MFIFLLATGFETGMWPVDAPGLPFLDFPPIPLAQQKITIDGSLQEWRSLEGYAFSPLGYGGNVILAQ